MSEPVTTRASTRLRARLAAGPIVLAPGVADALSARIAERAGFEALEVGGFAVTAGLLGLPDLGLLTLTEMLQVAGHITRAVAVPAIVDLDTGYGNALNVVRAVQECERIGAAAVHLEDQALPPNMSGRPVIPTEEMVGKVRAAVQARRDPDLLIVARCDALPSLGLEEAIRRGRAYRAAGADVIFVTQPRSAEEMRAITASIDAPHMHAAVEGGPSPLLPAAELQALGYAIVTHAVSLLLAGARAMDRAARALLSDGTTQGVADALMSVGELNGLLGMPEQRDLEAAYVPPARALVGTGG